MELPATNRRWTDLAPWSRRIFLLAILMLGVGVFSWGTAYKMSLYRVSPIHNKVPVAKLLTQSSKAIQDKVVSVTTPRSLTALPLLLDLALLMFALDLRKGWSQAVLAHKPLRRLSLYFPPALFLRPPPFPLHG